MMDQPPYLMDEARRRVVIAAIQSRCVNRNWRPIAAPVRMTHVHVIVDSEAPPERVMNDLKSYASRCLNQASLDEADRTRWARHGSTRYLWHREKLAAAIRYVVDGQGEPLAVFEG